MITFSDENALKVCDIPHTVLEPDDLQSIAGVLWCVRELLLD